LIAGQIDGVALHRRRVPRAQQKSTLHPLLQLVDLCRFTCSTLWRLHGMDRQGIARLLRDTVAP